MLTRTGNSLARLAPLLLICCAALAAARDANVQNDVVALNVQVVDKKGHYVDDAQVEDFRVREDGIEQKIRGFQKEVASVSYGVVADNSGSMRKTLDLVVRMGEAIVAGNRAGDETFVVRFAGGNKIQTLVEFTSSREELSEALSEMYVEGGETALIDAAYASVKRVAEQRKGEPNRARAVVLVTDGEERASRYQPTELIELLRGAGVRVFAIGLIGELDNQTNFISRNPRQRAVALLDSFAEASGGRAFYPKTGQELQQAVAEINRGLRHHYVLGYAPTNAARDGKFRKIKIEMTDAPGREDRKGVAPAGYFARQAGDDKTEKK